MEHKSKEVNMVDKTKKIEKEVKVPKKSAPKKADGLYLSTNPDGDSK